MSERVDPEEVRHIGELARIGLGPEDIELFSQQFIDILEYFDSLDEVPEIDGEADLVNVMRPDEVHESLDQETALSNAPETADEFFKGPPVS